MYKELMKKTFIFGIGSISVKLISFLLLPLYTSYLTPYEYGQIEIIMSTVSILVPIFTFGISIGILKFTIKNINQKDYVFGSLTVIWFLSLIFSFMFIYFIKILDPVNSYKYYFVIILSLTSLELLLSQYIKGNNYIKIFAISGVLKSLIFSIANIVYLSIFNIGTTGYLNSLIISISSSIIIYLIIILFRMKTSIKINKNILISIVIFSIPFVPNSISWWINNASDRFLILHFIGETAAGIYSVSYKIPIILIAIITIFNNAWQLVGLKNNITSDETSKIFKVYLFSLTILSILLINLSPIYSKLLFLNDFYIAWKNIPLLVSAMIFGAISNFSDVMIIKNNKTNKIFIPTFFGALLNIFLNIILIPKFGIIGAAIATFASYLSIFIVKVIIYERILFFKKHDYFLISISFIILIIDSIIITFLDLNIFNLSIIFVLLIAYIIVNLRYMILLIRYILNIIGGK